MKNIMNVKGGVLSPALEHDLCQNCLSVYLVANLMCGLLKLGQLLFIFAFQGESANLQRH